MSCSETDYMSVAITAAERLTWVCVTACRWQRGGGRRRRVGDVRGGRRGGVRGPAASCDGGSHARPPQPASRPASHQRPK